MLAHYKANFQTSAQAEMLNVPFLFLRKFTGGFHFLSALPCLAPSTLFLPAILAGIKALLPKPPLLAVSLAIDSINRKLTSKGQRAFRRIAMGLGCFFVALFTLLMGFELYRIAVPSGGGVVLIRAQPNTAAPVLVS